MNKENLKTWLGCAGYIVVAILLYKSCDWYSEYQKEKYKEEIRNDSIRKAFISDSIKKRKAFVADSLSRDPNYQDSVRRAEEYFKKWQKEDSIIQQSEIAGFALKGDSIYHTSFHSIAFYNDHTYGFTLVDIPKLTFVTTNEVKKKRIKLCAECEKTEDIRMRYEDGELFDEESAYDHDYIPKEEAEEFCHRHHDDY